MSVETIPIWLVVGAVAGVLAGVIVRGGGFGLLGDIVVGTIGAFFGGWLLPRLEVHLGVGLISVIASATIGAVVLLVGTAGQYLSTGHTLSLTSLNNSWRTS